MTELAFWRTEVWHPLTVHFPIALLLFGTLAKLAGLFLNPSSSEFWKKMGSVLLYFGCLGAWISLYTGDMADGIVSRKICDPTVLKDHEIAAYNLAYIFSAATLIDLGMQFNLIKVKLKLLSLVVTVLMLVGSGFLIYAGHLGAQVVYNQAGGVVVPDSDCTGF